MVAMTQPRGARGHRLLMAAGIIGTAFCLRLLFASLSVRLPEVVRATGLEPWQVGLLTTLPVLCLGLCAPLAPRLARRWGTERVLAGSLMLIGLGTACRALGPVWALFSFSILAGAAIAIANVLLPTLVKRDFEDRTALLTGAYVTAISGGAALAAAITIPVETWLGGGWQVGLSMWAVPVALALLLWAPQRRRGSRKIGAVLPVAGLWRDPLAWSVSLFMGLQSALAFCVLGWLAPILRDRGLDAVTAGLVLSVLIVVQLLTSLTVPSIATRQAGQRVIAALLSVAATAGLAGLLLAPLSGVWVWAIVQGLAQGGLFSLALTMVLLRSPDSHVASHLSSMAQGVGYLPAALAPLGIGLLHQWTGGFEAVAGMVVLIGIGLVVTGLIAGRPTVVLARAIERPDAELLRS
ncbi:MFS transporter [Brevundimonas sp. AJA228-03]|uniref:CynX/NimT family MFS transporter n=1 Tax=Brevundimonas sp. AJA228-03 TaxID=2752515 RepID=UPI001FD76C66|nr:MFS transporter [Brevundimonas sp. AJA228-03]